MWIGGRILDWYGLIAVIVWPGFDLSVGFFRATVIIGMYMASDISPVSQPTDAMAV